MSEESRQGPNHVTPDQLPSLHEMPLEALGLSTRSYNCLRRAGLRTLADVTAMSDRQLLSIRGLGTTTLTEIRVKMASYLENPRPIDNPSLTRPARQIPSQKGPATPPRRNHILPISPEQVNRLGNEHIDVLGLSTRPHHALIRNGITTVRQLAQLTPDRLKFIRNIGDKSIREIEDKLRTYLDRPHPPSESNRPAAPDYSLDPELLKRAKRVLLRGISIERLTLPPHLQALLRDMGIRSVGELVRRYTDVVAGEPLLAERLHRYLTWLVEQDGTTWANEISGRGISPLHHLILAETTLDEIVEDWLSPLTDRERKVLTWRLGMDGEPLTLEEIGRRLGVTRERVRQIQRKAMGRLLHLLNDLRRPHPLHALSAHLLHKFEAMGGLMTEAEVGQAMAETVKAIDIDVEWVARLWLNTCDKVKQPKQNGVWGLKTVPLKLIPHINRQLTDILERVFVPLTVDELLDEFKGTEFYKQHRLRLPDELLEACLRTHPEIEIADGKCKPEKWSRKRTPAIVQALTDIGEPAHYTTITERVNALLPAELRTTPHNTHAELLRRTDIFVRVGRGLFGLRAWGLPDDGNLANAAYRILKEAGHPLHIDEIVKRVLETWHVERPSIIAAISNDDRFHRVTTATFGLAEWETDLLNEAQPVLEICPPPIPDRRGERGTFFEAVLVARNLLREHPTTEDFIREMLTWTGTDPNKSVRYIQNVLNAFYIVGLIPYTVYRRSARATLHSTLPETDDIQALRHFCLDCMMSRLKRMPEFLALLAARQPCNAIELANDFHKDDTYSMRTRRDEVLSRLRILKALGAVTSIQGQRHRLTPLGEMKLKRWVQEIATYSDFTKTGTIPSEETSSVDIDWLDATV